MSSNSTLSIGNTQLAGDIYGNGVRAGVYIQVVSLPLAVIANKGRGIKLSSGAMAFALLISLSNLMQHNDISPAEFLVVLGLLTGVLLPAIAAFHCGDTIQGEGIAMICCLTANLWIALANILFWARLYRTLPALGTPGYTWYFYKATIQDRQTQIGSIVGVAISLVVAIWSTSNGISYVILCVQGRENPI